MNRSRSKLLAFAGLLVAVVVLVVAMVGGGAFRGAQPQADTQSRPSPGSTATAGSVANPSGLPTINASQLPKEARQTLALIVKGGPFPYARDGINFGNFEGVLPKRPSGFYAEYTVDTPGESDRGARRIIAGKDAAKYYTADHYQSFKFIVEGK